MRLASLALGCDIRITPLSKQAGDAPAGYGWACLIISMLLLNQLRLQIPEPNPSSGVHFPISCEAHFSHARVNIRPRLFRQIYANRKSPTISLIYSDCAEHMRGALGLRYAQVLRQRAITHYPIPHRCTTYGPFIPFQAVHISPCVFSVQAAFFAARSVL